MNALLRKTWFTLLLLCPLIAIAAPSVDINKADAAALEQINGIGPAKATAIIRYRDENGPFSSIDELQNVPGIGAKSFDQIRPQIELNAAPQE